MEPLVLTDVPLRLLHATEALGAAQELTLVHDPGDLPRGVVCPALRARDVPLAPAAPEGLSRPAASGP
jgi:hypothetical protein